MLWYGSSTTILLTYIHKGTMYMRIAYEYKILKAIFLASVKIEFWSTLGWLKLYSGVPKVFI